MDPELVAYLDRRFEAVDRRFADMDRRFEEVRDELRAEMRAGDAETRRHFDGAAIHAPQRQEFFFEQDPGREQGKKLAIRFDIFEGGVRDIVLLRQPSKDIFLGLNREVRSWRAFPCQCFCVQRRQLLRFHHALEQLL